MPKRMKKLALGMEISVSLDLRQVEKNEQAYFVCSWSQSEWVSGARSRQARQEETASGAGLSDTQEKHLPEMTDIFAFHLRNMDGTPLYPLENGYYYYAEGIRDNGDKEYYASEKERHIAETLRQTEAKLEFYKEFNRWTIGEPTLHDIWLAASIIRSSQIKNECESKIFERAFYWWGQSREKRYTLVVVRDNKALARHLLISLEEAETIPAGLTKKEFEERYITPNLERWKAEADRLIKKYGLTVTHGR